MVERRSVLNLVERRSVLNLVERRSVFNLVERRSVLNLVERRSVLNLVERRSVLEWFHCIPTSTSLIKIRYNVINCKCMLRYRSIFNMLHESTIILFKDVYV